MWGPGNREERQLKIARAESKSWKGVQERGILSEPPSSAGFRARSFWLAVGSGSWQRKH